jgi:protein SCO1
MRPAGLTLLVFVAFGASAVIVMRTAPNFLQPGNIDADDASNLAFQPHPGTQLPLATKLLDESGHPVALGDYFAKSPVILVLEYLRCTSLCGVILRSLVVDALSATPLEPGRDYQIVAVSIDPRDKPADAASARAKYAGLLRRDRGAGGLHFLTGSSAMVKQIADAIGFRYRYDALLDAYIHPAGFVIVAPDGVISRYVEGVSISSAELIRAIADAEQDKSQGLITRVLLFCHVQGAPLGRFTVPVLTAFTVANVAAGFTLIALFAAIRRRRNG